MSSDESATKAHTCPQIHRRSEDNLRNWQFFSIWDRDETLVRLETVSRPRRRDRDHNPGFSRSRTSPHGSSPAPGDVITSRMRCTSCTSFLSGDESATKAHTCPQVHRRSEDNLRTIFGLTTIL